MKFDMFDAIRILAAEFGSGRSIIEVEDRISSYRLTLRVFFSGEMYNSQFEVSKVSDEVEFFNEKFKGAIAQIRQLYNAEMHLQVKR